PAFRRRAGFRRGGIEHHVLVERTNRTDVAEHGGVEALSHRGGRGGYARLHVRDNINRRRGYGTTCLAAARRGGQPQSAQYPCEPQVTPRTKVRNFSSSAARGRDGWEPHRWRGHPCLVVSNK